MSTLPSPVSSEPGEVGKTAGLAEWIAVAGHHLLCGTQGSGHRFLLPPICKK